MQIGRIELFTDEKEITQNNVLPILQKAFAEYQPTIAKINFLLDYEAGEQPLKRVKKYRKDIDIVCNDNIANEITEFNLGFKWGNPITLVQRGAKVADEGKEILGISMLNDCYETENSKAKNQQNGRFIEICGIGYTYVDINDEWQEGDSYFNVMVLDPRYAFVVKSSYYADHRPMLGVTFRIDKQGNRHFTCFSKTQRFEILNAVEITNGKKKAQKNKWGFDERNGEANPLGLIPIIEWIRGYDRMGCFERQIPEMDNLNILISDFTNDVDQNTQAIWHCNDVDFPMKEVKTEDSNGNIVTEQVVETPKTNDFLQTYTSGEGKTPFVTPLSVQYDYEGMLNNIVTRRALILQKCNVPQRNDNSGGSTGVAMSDATGWSAAEMAASKQQNITEACKMNEVRVVLAAIKKSPHVKLDNPLLSLTASRLQPNIKRQKTYELTVKTNAIATLLSHGFDGESVINTISIFEDNNQVWQRSREGIEAYQRSVYDTSANNQAEGGEGENSPNADRLSADESDQITNSPNIDGMSTGRG